MNLSRRERWCLLIACLMVGLWALDAWVLSPIWNAYQDDADEAQRLEQNVLAAKRLLRNAKMLRQEWSDRRKAGVTMGVSESETRLLSVLGSWAQKTGLHVSSMKAERREHPNDKTMQVITCRVVANGTMEAMTRFLWDLETAGLPLRVELCQFSSADPTRNSVSIQIQLSTICIPDKHLAANPSPQRRGVSS